MGLGYPETKEISTWLRIVATRKPWAMKRFSGRDEKTFANRKERRRAKRDPECIPQYSAINNGYWY